MNTSLRITVLIIGACFFAVVLRLLSKRDLDEKNALIWFVSASGILILALSPMQFEVVANFFGVDYPPALLFLFAIIIAFLVILYQSIQISRLNGKVAELSQHIAILNHCQQKIAACDQQEISADLFEKGE